MEIYSQSQVIDVKPIDRAAAQNHQHDATKPLQRGSFIARHFIGYCASAVSALILFALNGCGAGGYVGGGITGLSKNNIVIDAGQSIPVTATVSGGLNVSWSLSASCGSQASCGSLSASTGSNVTYSAPASLTAPIHLTLVATVAGTNSTSTSTITVNPAPKIVGNSPTGVVGIAYGGSVNATGGTTPLNLMQSGGNPPPGIEYTSSTGLLAGTPTTVGTYVMTMSLTDGSDVPQTWTQQVTVVIVNQASAALAIGGNPGAGQVGVAYTAQLTTSGGVAPYTWSISSGALPSGLAIGASSGLITGTPTTAGTFGFTAMVQDSQSTQASASFVVTINPASSGGGSPVTITTGTLPPGTVGMSYSAQIGASGGTSPYSCVQTGGTIPTGLSLAANCTVSGTPTSAGTSVMTVQVSDSASPTNSTSGPVSITINPAPGVLALSSPPAGTVGTPYSGSIGVSGGTPPYTCTLISGTMPGGLTLNPNCSLGGTPTASGAFTVTVKATDSEPTPSSVTGPVTITINPATVTLTITSPPSGTVGILYTGGVGVSGGTAPYTCALVAGSMPAGLTLNANCSITGTPAAAGDVTVTVKATDASSPANSNTSPVTITINPATVTLVISSPPAGTVGTPYSGSVGVSGGTGPYTCALASGTTPAGLTLNANCSLSGTPTAAGTSTFQVKATDSSSPSNSTTGPVTITINPSGVTLTLTSPPSGTSGTPYSGSVGVNGGTAPYTCTLVSGTMPAGLTLNANCTISGTPTSPGVSTITVKATDSANPANSTTGTVSITINPATTTLTLTSPPAGTLDTPYSGSVGVSGGTPPYTCHLASGTMPAGLTLNANCSISGTPAATGTTTETVTATDSASPQDSGTGPVTITINPIPKLTLTLAGSLPYAVLGQAYSQTLQAAGGIAPYTYAITAGSLPPGISLSTGGVISGTPTAVGASSFTVTATDSEPTPQTASLPLVLLVIYPPGPNDGELNGPYAFLFQGYDDVISGVLAYQTATVGSFVANGAGALTTGELDTNHQSTVASGNTVPTLQLLGTYTIGTDNRGMMAITTLNANGTTGSTNTYAISVKAPVSPATTSASGALIEYDDANLVGTRGSGTFLAQTDTAGLAGSYAFGLSGDTPCLPSCTLGIVAGPAASVGQFAIDSGAITGTGDANIAETHYSTEPLTGTTGAADAFGRVQLTMDTAGTPSGVYPSDYAVYQVNANQAFVMSTDKHEAFVLLAGSASLQTTGSFADSTLSGAFVGYENSPTNPGLAGVVLQDVLNLSTATIIRGTANGSGTCDTTNVDIGGTTGLVNALTGLGSGSTVLNALLGTYQSTGNSSCVVESNGRTVFNYPQPNSILEGTLELLGLGGSLPAPRVVYLYSQNAGYYLETGYAGLGHMAQQTGSPFTAATLDGTFVYGTTPAAASLASTDASGFFTANGAGKANWTVDENVGVGNINILDLGVTGSGTYTLTDATAGRYLLAPSTVIYAITPGSFVLLNTGATVTSPSVVLLQ